MVEGILNCGRRRTYQRMTKVLTCRGSGYIIGQLLVYVFFCLDFEGGGGGGAGLSPPSPWLPRPWGCRGFA